MALIKCFECGNNVSEKASECPRCGCPIDISIKGIEDIKMEKRKITIKAMLIILVILILGIVVYSILKRPDTSGYYNGFKWGISSEAVQKKLGGAAILNDEKETISITCEDFEGRLGIDTIIIYGFENNALKEVSIYITNEDDSSYTDDSLIEEYLEQFNKLYGEYNKDSFFYLWNTDKSRIELHYLMDGVLVLTYEDITKVSE